MNIFEQASKKKLRFPSIKGELTVEQLWDLPLVSKVGFDLDCIAKSINSQLKSVADESFVVTSDNPAKGLLELQLEIAKHIIAVKIEVAETARNKAAKSAEREKLLGILAEKQDEALKALTPDELAKRIAELG